MKEKYIEECAVIQQNCMYTAEAHHFEAAHARCLSFWLESIPAVGAAISSALVASGIAGEQLLPLTVVATSVAAITSVIGPSKHSDEHLSAAKSFTSLKHDARFLREAKSSFLDDNAFAIAVENLHIQYNELIKTVPPTGDKSFDKARKKIQAGIHDPDKDCEGKVK
jgi:hypothetical protein